MSEHEDKIVVEALKNYYVVCKNNRLETDLKILDAIEIVLKDFLTPTQYQKWRYELFEKEIEKYELLALQRET